MPFLNRLHNFDPYHPQNNSGVREAAAEALGKLGAVKHLSRALMFEQDVRVFRALATSLINLVTENPKLLFEQWDSIALKIQGTEFHKDIPEYSCSIQIGHTDHKYGSGLSFPEKPQNLDF
jgi:hypothetical protein